MLNTLIKSPKPQAIQANDASNLMSQAAKAIVPGNSLTVARVGKHTVYRVRNAQGNQLVTVTLCCHVAWVTIGANRATLIDRPVAEFIVSHLMNNLPMAIETARKFA